MDELTTRMVALLEEVKDQMAKPEAVSAWADIANKGEGHLLLMLATMCLTVLGHIAKLEIEVGELRDREGE